MYTAVEKKPKACEPKDEKETPPIPPPHTVEELYTAVQKNSRSRSRSNADKNKDEAPPPHTVEETQAAGDSPSQSAIKNLYTAAMKKPKIPHQSIHKQLHQYLHTQWKSSTQL